MARGVFCILVASAAHHAPAAERLSLSAALALAEDNAPALNAAAKGAQAAREMAVAGAQLPDPIVRLGVDNLPANGPDAWSLTNDFMTMRRLGVMQEYVSADKRALQRSRSNLEAERWMATRHRLKTQLRQDVALAWFDHYYAVKSRDLLKALESELDLQLRTLASQIRAGKAMPGDATIATLALLQVQDRALVADKQQRQAQIALSRWLGKDASRTPGDAPDIEALAFEPTSPSILSSVASLREHDAERELACAELALSRSNRRPNWSWELAYSQRGPAYSNMISLGVSIPLTFNASNKQDREIAARQLQLEQAHASHLDMQREAEVAIGSAYAEWTNLIDRRRRLAQALLPLARQRLDLALTSYRAGQGNLASVLEARRGEVESRMQLLELERETAKLWAQLNFAYAEVPSTRVAGARP